MKTIVYSNLAKYNKEFNLFNADVVPKTSIRIYGHKSNGFSAPVKIFDKTFRIGDVAKHGCYNLTYTGKIVAITPKTVVVERSDIGRCNRRFSIEDFIIQNYNFDLAEIDRRNSDTMQRI